MILQFCTTAIIKSWYTVLHNFQNLDWKQLYYTLVFGKAENVYMHAYSRILELFGYKFKKKLYSGSVFHIYAERWISVECELSTTWHIANLVVGALRTWMCKTENDSHCWFCAPHTADFLFHFLWYLEVIRQWKCGLVCFSF